jgi:hypothetical protein
MIDFFNWRGGASFLKVYEEGVEQKKLGTTALDDKITDKISVYLVDT